MANLTDWLEVTRADGLKGRRETNTMPQWAGSSWYYLRYIDPNNSEALADPELLKNGCQLISMWEGLNMLFFTYFTLVSGIKCFMI